MPKYTEQQLQNAMKDARKEPIIPLPRIAALQEVNITILRRRLAATQVSNCAAKRDTQLFSPGEERAISEHCGVMADLGFPVTKNLLQYGTRYAQFTEATTQGSGRDIWQDPAAQRRPN